MSKPKNTYGAYYPSMVCNFKIRFDETLHIVQEPDNGDKSAISSLLKDNSVNVSNNPTSGKNTPVISNLVEYPVGMSHFFGQNSTPDYTQAFNIVPIKASIDMTGIRQAWKFNLTFDFKDLPIDPRTIRDARVEIHLGVVTPEEFADGMVHANQFKTAELRPPSILNTEKNGLPNPDTFLFLGLVDNWVIDNDSNGSIVSVEGRDLRGVLLDVKIRVEDLETLNVNQPISNVIRDIIKTLPLDYSTKIVIETDFPILGKEPSPGDVDMVTRPRKSANSNREKNEKVIARPRMKPKGSDHSGGDHISYWQLITQYCFLVGVIPYWEGTKIILRPARSIFDQIKGPQGLDAISNTVSQAFGGKNNYPTPFKDGQPREVDLSDGNTETLRIRRLVFGRDIENLKYERKFNSQAVPIVELVSIDDSQRGVDKLIRVQWPEPDSPAAQIKADNERIRVPVHGIKDKKRLLDMAHDIYEEIGHGEIGGSCSTTKLTSFGGEASDPDLLRLKPTDAIEFLVDTRALSSRSPLVSELVDNYRLSYDEQVDILTKKFKDKNLARVLAASYRGNIIEALRYYKVNNVKYDWSDNGIAISFDFINYIVSRQNEKFDSDPNYTPKSVTVNKPGAGKKAGTTPVTLPKNPILKNISNVITNANNAVTGNAAATQNSIDQQANNSHLAEVRDAIQKNDLNTPYRKTQTTEAQVNTIDKRAIARQTAKKMGLTEDAVNIISRNMQDK